MPSRLPLQMRLRRQQRRRPSSAAMSDMAQLLESRRARIGRWAVAACIVCALHIVGGALALMSWREEETEYPAAGAMSLDMAPPTPTQVDAPDAPRVTLQDEKRLMSE